MKQEHIWKNLRQNLTDSCNTYLSFRCQRDSTTTQRAKGRVKKYNHF